MDFVYDIETYRNMFSVGLVETTTQTRWIYEVSDRRDQSVQFGNFIRWLKRDGHRMVGYNNEGFDWYVTQNLVNMGRFTAEDAYRLGQRVIETQGNDRFGLTIWPSDRIIPQIDLYKIHHFDNRSKSTSLKKLEINMRARRVIDLPYSPHDPLTPAQMDHVIAYMCHDIAETMNFWMLSQDQIKFREDLAAKYPDMGDVLNFNDTKIGKKFFERELEQRLPGACYEQVNGRRQPRQTKRTSIRLADVISPLVRFQHPEFQRVHQWLMQQTLTQTMIEDALSESVETKGVFKGLHATIDGFTFHFGTGGIHGSVSSAVIREDDHTEIVDADVSSFYPNLGITNRWYPAHLGESFCDIYETVYKMRKGFGKKTAENAMLKLALNGVYGSSNDKFSVFFDPAYTMAITINGQLLLCMLAESLMAEGFKIIQANTDGVTFQVDRARRSVYDAICKEWEAHTKLELEFVNYKAMMIRDVNSYLAVKLDDSVKRIGAYAYETPLENPYTRELGWHKDHSMRVVAMAAEAEMVRGIPVDQFIMSHRDPFDFMLSIKVPRNGRLEANGVPVQNTSRYYVSTDGAALTKFLPGLRGGPERDFAVQKGWTTTIVNDADLFRWDNVNWYFYITEARKLLV